MSAAIFNAGTVKILKDVLQFKSTNKITMQGTVDPTATAVDGIKGDLYIRASTGALYKKLSNGLDVNWSEIMDAASIISNYIPLSQKGAVNGVVPLNGAGKIDTAYIPGSYIQYKGMWNAATNSPTLADGTGTAGWFYEVNVAGTQNLGSGSQTFKVGDWVVHDGTKWDISTNSNEVVSVNGLSGAVNLTTTNIAEGTNLYHTVARAKAAAVSNTLTSGITDVAPSQNAVFNALAAQSLTNRKLVTAGSLSVSTSSSIVKFDGAINNAGGGGGAGIHAINIITTGTKIISNIDLVARTVGGPATFSIQLVGDSGGNPNMSDVKFTTATATVSSGSFTLTSFAVSNYSLPAGSYWIAFTMPANIAFQASTYTNSSKNSTDGGTTWTTDLTYSFQIFEAVSNFSVVSSQDSFVEVAGLLNTANKIATFTTAISDLSVLYVTLNYVNTPSLLTVSQSLISTCPNNVNTFILARRVGSNVYISDELYVADGANQALSNLTTTSINSSLLFNTTDLYDVGSTTKQAAAVHSGNFLSNGTMNITARLSAAMNHIAAVFRFSNSNGTTGASLQLFTGGDANTVSLTAPTTIAANVNYTLPAAPTVTGQVLSSTTSGLMSWSTPAASGASTSLNNLTTTSINQSLLPDTTASRDIGSTTLAWLSVYSNKFINAAGTGLNTVTGTLDFAGTAVVSIITNGLRISSNKLLRFTSGDGFTTTGIKVATTTATLDYTLPAAIPTVSGQVLSSTTAGVMSWTSATSGASTSLNNLATTSINQSLLPDVNITRNLGSSTLSWASGFFNKIESAAGIQIDVASRLLQFNGVTIASWFSSGIAMAAAKFIRFTSGDGLTTLDLTVPNTMTNQAYTLPAAYPVASGHVLTGTTAGIFSWKSLNAGIINAQVRRATSSQTIGTTNTKIQFNAITSDPTNSFDAVTNFRFTVPTGGDGVYQFNGNLSYAAAGALLTSYALLYKNGGPIITASNSASLGAAFGLSFNFQITAVAGDFFEIFAVNSTSSTLLSDGTISGGSTLNIYRLGV